MKKSSLFYAILFLLISPIAVLATEVNLNESSNGDMKTVAVEIDTKGEAVNSLKIAIEVSDNVTVGEIKEGEYACGTFSSTQNGSVIEITCTTQKEAAVNTSIAKISFTTTTVGHTFTVLTEQSQIGDLTIDSTRNIEAPTLNDTTDNTTQADGTTTPTQEVASKTDTRKEKTFTSFLPYILLGVAGILLLSIIILLVTKEKGSVAKTEQTETPTEVKEPVITPPSEETTVEEKPTLQEMVNAGIGTTATDTGQTTPPVGDHQKDLEALIMSENPRADGSPTTPDTAIEEQPVVTPTYEAPVTPQENVMTDTLATPVTTPITEPVTTPTFEEPTTPQENVATDTFTTPMETPIAEPVTTPTFEAPTAPQEAITTTDTFTTPMETPIAEPVTTPTFEEPTMPQENVSTKTYTTPMETPVTEPITPPVVEIPIAPQETVADTSEDLPNIGFTAPTEPTTTTPTDFYSNLYGTPTEQTIPQTEIEVSQSSADTDLQTLVNNEINNIPTGVDTTQQPTPIEPETTTEQPQI